LNLPAKSRAAAHQQALPEQTEFCGRRISLNITLEIQAGLKQHNIAIIIWVKTS
jgi:hypothetical protein